MTRLGILALTLAAASLSACTGQAVISNAHKEEYYEQRMLAYPASRGGMYTEVTGNPFQTEQAVLNREVTQAFEEAHFGPKLSFFTELPSDGTPGFRTVVLFDPPRTANAKRLCTSPERPQAQHPEGEVRVMGALCNGDTRLTSATGIVTGATGPNDPAVRKLLRQLGLSLFPPSPGVLGDENDAYMP